MGEEHLRTQFLVALNGQYEASATGETFNGRGKTDILLRHDGGSTFIAECKIWKGPAVLVETIDQLLVYTTWRDTKSAILVFNRNKSLTAVLNQIRPTVAAHRGFWHCGRCLAGCALLRDVRGDPLTDRDALVAQGAGGLRELLDRCRELGWGETRGYPVDSGDHYTWWSVPRLS